MVVPDFDVMTGELAEACERPDRIVVIVEYRDVRVTFREG
jgi:hypothetical protein